MMACDHKYKPLKKRIEQSEARVKCTLCGQITIVPSVEQSDIELEAAFDASLHDGPPIKLFQAIAKLYVRAYEKETKLPYFVGSKDYANWLNKRLPKK